MHVRRYSRRAPSYAEKYQIDLERARAALAARYGLADEARARIETLRGSHDPRVQRIVRSVQEGSPSSTKAAQ